MSRWNGTCSIWCEGVLAATHSDIGMQVQITNLRRFKQFTANMRGPMDVSNWVVMNKLLVGGYPCGQVEPRACTRAYSSTVSHAVPSLHASHFTPFILIPQLTSCNPSSSPPHPRPFIRTHSILTLSHTNSPVPPGSQERSVHSRARRLSFCDAAARYHGLLLPHGAGGGGGGASVGADEWA